MTQYLKIVAVGSVIVLLNACSTAPYQTESPTPVEERGSSQPVDITELEPISTPPADTSTEIAPPSLSVPKETGTVVTEPAPRSPAVIALLSNANQQQQRGDYRSAQNTLQRAQRIAPKDAEVYYELAQTHLELETYRLAEQVALKGASLVSGQAKQQKRFWNLIAKIRLQAGNPVGAEMAQRRADKY